MMEIKYDGNENLKYKEMHLIYLAGVAKKGLSKASTAPATLTTFANF